MNIFIKLLLIFFAAELNAFTVSQLTFEATQNCPVFVSKGERTDTDNLQVIQGQSYIIRAVDNPHPNWFRIIFPKPYAVRWVSAACGYAKQGNVSSACSSMDMADSYVLALSAQPGFCETYGLEAGKIECLKLKEDSYAAKHLTLHGLWPNKDACGQRYGFCSGIQHNEHCDYAPIELSKDVANVLKDIMPSYHFGSCLERHEWYKHGTCQRRSPNDYFSLAMKFVLEVDKSSLGIYITEHIGQTVSLAKLREMSDRAFGADNAEKIYLGCKNGVLVELFIQLPANPSENDSLVDLVNRAPNNHYKDSCPSKVKLSHFTKSMWM